MHDRRPAPVATRSPYLGAGALAAVLVVALVAVLVFRDGGKQQATPTLEDRTRAAAEPSTRIRAGTVLGRSPGATIAALAARSESLSKEKIKPQAAPEAIDVTDGTTSWSVGSTYRGIFADPEIVKADGRWLAYATNTSQLNLPTLVSEDLRTWTPISSSGGGRYDPLPGVGDWVTIPGPGHGLWAPAVEKIGDGWTMAYSAQIGTIAGERHNCIGLARGESAAGPFQHLGGPFLCAPESRLGVIDPDFYVDPNGRAWMMWKFSGVVDRRPAGIFSRQLNGSGTGWAENSTPIELLTLQGGWEGNTIENPSMIDFRGVTYLFYSAHAYTTDQYATGYAVCSGPSGPCVRPSSGPLLSTATTGTLGPGGASAFVNDRSLYLLYHAWAPGQVNRLRRLHVAGLWQRPDKTLELRHPG